MPRVTQALGGRRGLSTALCTVHTSPPPSVGFQWNGALVCPVLRGFSLLSSKPCLRGSSLACP